jgi:glutathione peroxidase
MNPASFHDFTVRRLEGADYPMSQLRGQVVLVVNTASACGFTPQYEGLETLQQQYGPRGFTVLAFPCNQFGKQEPGSAQQIAAFCDARFRVTFPLMEKVEVNGPGAIDLYRWLKAQAPGVLGSEAIKWNFTKFLVGRDGRVVRRYAPMVKPAAIARDLEAVLA